jgi:CheY-like chemotaxis protein
MRNSSDVLAMTDDVVTILLVDDDKFDTKAVRRSFQALRFDNPVVEARNGIQAMDLLRGENGHEMVRWPFVILLDLNMPGMDGFDFLEKLRNDPDFRRAPVFVISGSESAEDRTRAYNLNIVGFIRKHGPSRSFLKEVQMLQHYIQVTEFPEQESATRNTGDRLAEIFGLQGPQIGPVVPNVLPSFEQPRNVEASGGRAFGSAASVHSLTLPSPSFHYGIVSLPGIGQCPMTQKGLTPQFLRDEAARFRGMADDSEATKERFLAIAADYDARALVINLITDPDLGGPHGEAVQPTQDEAVKITLGRKIAGGSTETTLVRRPVGRPRRE